MSRPYNTFLHLLATKPYLLADGATGTNLFSAGLATGEAPELWNIDQPGKILAHYQAFADAGSDIILTNTFGGNTYRLKLHKAQDQVDVLNIAGAKLARKVAKKANHAIAIAGSMGPTGEIFEPNGDLTKDKASTAFRAQAKALKAGGVDVLWLETMSAIEEVEAAIDGISDLGLPIVFTMSVDTNGRTMMGVTPPQIIRFSNESSAQIHAYGTNCGIGAAEVVATILSMQKAAQVSDQTNTLASPQKPTLIAKANCGIPQWLNGEIVYNGTPELMALFTQLALDAGAQIVGGCCGTTYEHVAAMRKAMDTYRKDKTLSIETIINSLGEISTGAIKLVEGDNSINNLTAEPRGRRRRKR